MNGKLGFNLSTIFVQALSILLIYSESVRALQDGQKIGAYISTPDPNKLEYRNGNGIGGIGNGWDDGRLSNLSSWGGYDGQRKKLPEYHLVNWGYGIEVGDCQTNTKCGILDVIGYLCGPTKEHSTNRLSPYNNYKEVMPPANLYEPIWKEDGSVNTDNYWANYIYQTVSTYKDYIKIWETWNEPDYTRNYGAIESWRTNPPNKDDLPSWHGTIFEYIRLLRITYEVAKKVDPDCWVATGGLGYTSFLDAILRYTDNPNNGAVSEEYPAKGGAYFDCEAYHQYPKYGVTDEETGEGYNDNGSDTLAKKVVILKKNHQYTIKKHGFGDTYPDKLYINTETGYDNGETEESSLIRRNWIIKLALYQIEYDVKQINALYIADGGKGMGDFQNIGKFVSVEEGYKHLKDSSKGRVILKRMNIGKYIFDKDKTKNFRVSLPEGITGIVLKRKFPRVVNETYYSDYIYSIWLECIKEENHTTINYMPDLPFLIRRIDWRGNEKNFTKNTKIAVTSTPIFLLNNFDKKEGEKRGEFAEKIDDDDDDEGGTSGFVVFLEVVGIIALIVVVAIVGLYCYRRCVQKKNIPLDKDFFSSLLH